MGQERRVLVTGGAGFIGSHLAKELLAEHAHVDCVDSLITGRIDTILPLRAFPTFRFLKMDITEPAFLRHALASRYDAIYHLACPTGVPNIKTFGEEMIRTCSLGTEHVLQIACAHDAKLIYTSSAEVYGNPEVFPQPEDYCGNVDPCGPRGAYEEGKRFGETLVRLYADKYRVDGKIVRIFNTFGAGMSPHDSRVIPQFLRRIRDGLPITIYGDGSQTRTHLYVDDLIAALRLILVRGAAGSVYNVGGERQLSILELVETIRSLTPMPIRVEHAPHFIEDHAGRLPMLDKVRALGWQQRVTVREGLRRMLASYDMPVRDPELAPARSALRPTVAAARQPAPTS